MAISYQKHGDLVYGTVCKVRREGKKVIKEYGEQLGRLVDRDRLVFYSKKHGGLFRYDEKTGAFLPPPDDVQAPVRKSRAKVQERPVCLSFGAVYLLDAFMKRNGLYDIIDYAFPDRSDAVKAMTVFYIASSLDNRYFADWLKCTAACWLYPEAMQAASQPETLLEYAGDATRRQLFMLSWLDWIKKNSPGDMAGNILTDSTGLPASVHFPLTAVKSSDDDISEEVRLVCLVQQASGLPLYFRAIPEGSTDMDAIQRAAARMQNLGMGIGCVTASAGHYSDADITALHEGGIDFLVRIEPGHPIYKAIVAKHLSSIEEDGVLVRLDNRLARVKRIPCRLCTIADAEGRITDQGFDGYAYLCVDEQRKALDVLRLGKRAIRDSLSVEKYEEEQQEAGVFMLISSKSIDAKDVIAVYGAGKQAEQSFDLSRNCTGTLRLSIQKEEAFNGHMMLAFIAAIAKRMLMNALVDTTIKLEDALEILSLHSCVQYKDKCVACEPSEKAREIYDALGTEYPVTLSGK